MTTPLIRQIAELVEKNDPTTLIVHSDIFKTRRVIAPDTPPALMPERQIEALEAIAGGRPLRFPAFNYDFPRTRTFDPANDPSQVGVLTEFARTRWASWRKGPPIFSFCGKEAPAPELPATGRVDPFDDSSLFGSTRISGGDILLYGAPLASITAMHHIERLAGGPVYRYDKLFRGTIRNSDGEVVGVELLFHVRPMGMHLDYDWPMLESDALARGLIEAIPLPSAKVMYVHYRALADHWAAETRKDPLFLLDAASRRDVSSHLDRIGRRFVLSDFEDNCEEYEP